MHLRILFETHFPHLSDGNVNTLFHMITYSILTWQGAVKIENAENTFPLSPEKPVG